MNNNKSLFMVEFMKQREDIGTIEYYPVINILYMNLYDKIKSESHSTEVIQLVKDVKEDIQDKTLMILENEPIDIGPNPLPDLFSDLPEDIIDENEIKKVQISTNIGPEKQVKEGLKQIVIDPNYIVKNP